MKQLNLVQLVKSYFGNTSFRKKLLIITVVQSFIVLLLVTLAFVMNELILKKNEINNELKTYAELIAHNSAAPLLFNDQMAAKETLKGFRDHRQILSAYILDANNNLFASYLGETVAGGPEIKSPNQLIQESSVTDPWWFLNFLHSDSKYKLQILDEGNKIGTVLIQADLREFTERINHISVIAVIVFISAMILTYFISKRLERVITEPITSLAEIMENVSRSQNFSTRAEPPHYNDEVGSLIYGFNIMLAHIEQRDRELARYSHSLEDKIIERTSELSAVNMQLQNSVKSLENAKKTAEEANLAKTRFLANMSHEIRTPMNGIMGMTEMLIQSGLSEKQTRYATTVKNSTVSLLTIINDILDFSKIEAGKLELEIIPFNLTKLISEIIGNFSHLATQKQISLKTIHNGSLPDTVEGDPVRIRQILSNLIANAIKFTEIGVVTFSVTPPDNFPDDTTIKFTVKDSGVGISSEALPHIFDRFAQADTSTTRKFGGTGLGLAIVKQLVELMGGLIEVESTPELGSTFTVFIPLKPAPQAETVIESDYNEARLLLIGKTVLLVEDTAINKDVCSEILSMLGCKISFAENGKEALDCLVKEKFDIVLMDCQMPVMNGYDCTSLFRAWEQNNRLISERTPVIALTGNAMEQDRQRCFECGMDDIILKPFQLQQFVSCLSFNIKKRLSGQDNILKDSMFVPQTFQSENSCDNKITLNHNQLDQLKYLQKNTGENILEQFVTRYIHDSPKLIENIKLSWHSNDLEAVTATIHKLKTSSGMMGAEQLSQLCFDTEDLLRNENRLPDLEIIKKMESLSEQYNTLLRQEINIL